MNQDQAIKKTGFNIGWKNTDAKDINSNDEYLEMRDWQLHAFELLKAVPFMILNAPMGSGKSSLMCWLSAFKMMNDKSLRCIIVVPQTIIAAGFIDEKLQMPGGEKVHWQIKHNLCSDKFKNSTVKYFIEWLEKQPKNFLDQIILCTHATLVAVYKQLKIDDRRYLLNNLLLWIDEAHHIKNVKTDYLDDMVINNGIGELVAYFLNNRTKNLQMGLTTASFFRGDRASLLTDEMESQFKRFNLPYDEYLQSMSYLKSFSFDFLLSGLDYIKAIEVVVKDRDGKDIVYIPHPVSQYSTGKKYQEVEDIISIYGVVDQITADGVTVVYSEKGNQKILDLVSEINRKQKKNYLDNPVLKKQSEALDVIIALGMFKEGANWIYANRSIIVGARSSLVDIIQMIGRLFRDVKEKNHVEVVQLLPFSLDQQDQDGFRENLNNYLKAIYASLLLENILNPVKIRSMQNVEKEKHEATNSDTKNWLNIALPDEAKQQSLMEDVRVCLFDIMSTNKDAAGNVRVLYNEYSKVIPQVLEDYGITECKQEISKQIWGTFVRRSMQMQGLSVENIDFDIIHETHPLGFLLRYTSGTCDLNTFEKLRTAIALSRVIWRSFTEAREFVRQLKLKSETEWRDYIRGKRQDLQPLPNDIPRAPWVAYERDWISWGDFLGTLAVAPRLRKYRSYESACEFVHALNLQRKDDWALYVKGKMPHLPPLPDDIPASPAKTYQRKEYGEKWISWGDFLGTGKISAQNKSKGWRSYQEAHEFVKTLHLKTAKEWNKYISGELLHLPLLPHDIPKKPDTIYEEWVDWPSFLGNTTISKFNCKREFLPFIEARAFVHTLGLRTQKEWQAYCRSELTYLPEKPLAIPSNPSKKYKDSGWINLKDWLGT